MKKVLKNILTSALPQLVNIISNLILPGLIIIRFGSEINGLVSTTKTIVSYISIVGAGIAAAVTQALYKPVAENSIDEVKGMLHAANNMFVKYGLIYTLVTVVVAFLYPVFLNTDIRYFTIVLLLLVMSISGASEFFVTGRCRALLYANQEVYVSSIIQSISLLLSLGFAVIMLRTGFNIIIVQLSISAVYILRAGFLLLYVNLRYPQFRNYNCEPPILRTVEKRNDAMIHQLSGLVVTGSQALILTLICGLEAASIFSVYSIVFTGLQSICANLSTSVTPFLGRELALERKQHSMIVYNLIEYGFFVLVTIIYSATIVLIIPFVSIYTKGADINYVFKTFSVLYVFTSAFYVLKMPSTSATNAAGLFKETRIRAIVEASICVLVSVPCCVFLGQIGVLIGTLSALSWRCFDSILFTNKFVLHQKNTISIFRVIRALIIIGGFGVFSYIYHISLSGYLNWIKNAFLFVGVACCVIIIDGIVFELGNIRFLFTTLFKKKEK